MTGENDRTFDGYMFTLIESSERIRTKLLIRYQIRVNALWTLNTKTKQPSIVICNVQLAEHFVCSSRMFTTRKRRINRNDHEINKNDMHLKLAISSPPTLNIISNSNPFGNFPCLPKWRWKIRGPATSNSFSFFQAWEFKIAKFNFTFIFKLVFTHNQLWWMHQ